ncbi:unnamed protein product [Musa hybrid cultivar]
MMRWRNITASTLSTCSRMPQRCRPSSFDKDGHQESCRARKDVERYLFMLGSPNRGGRINLLFPAIVIQVDYVFGDVNGLLGSLRKWNPVANVDGWQGAASSNSALPPSGRCDFTITSQAMEASYMGGGGGVGWPTSWGSSALMLR